MEPTTLSRETTPDFDTSMDSISDDEIWEGDPKPTRDERVRKREMENRNYKRQERREAREDELEERKKLFRDDRERRRQEAHQKLKSSKAEQVYDPGCSNCVKAGATCLRAPKRSACMACYEKKVKCSLSTRIKTSSLEISGVEKIVEAIESLRECVEEQTVALRELTVAVQLQNKMTESKEKDELKRKRKSVVKDSDEKKYY